MFCHNLKSKLTLFQADAQYKASEDEYTPLLANLEGQLHSQPQDRLEGGENRF